ncbi:hypothetical protein KCP73_18965 [Salmonella enterica subsp. enterica]|nr:hypothetical protein KCP73_18965 [Salmonella enterica subsp. enterica]
MTVILANETTYDWALVGGSACALGDDHLRQNNPASAGVEVQIVGFRVDTRESSMPSQAGGVLAERHYSDRPRRHRTRHRLCRQRNWKQSSSSAGWDLSLTRDLEGLKRRRYPSRMRAIIIIGVFRCRQCGLAHFETPLIWRKITIAPVIGNIGK